MKTKVVGIELEFNKKLDDYRQALRTISNREKVLQSSLSKTTIEGEAAEHHIKKLNTEIELLKCENEKRKEATREVCS